MLFVSVAVCHAQLSISNGVFLTKPDPYVEFSVDGQQKHRTDVERKTLQPSWNAEFSVLVMAICSLWLNWGIGQHAWPVVSHLLMVINILNWIAIILAQLIVCQRSHVIASFQNTWTDVTGRRWIVCVAVWWHLTARCISRCTIVIRLSRTYWWAPAN